MINCWLAVGYVQRFAFPGPFQLDGRGVLEKNWSKILGKWGTDVCIMYIYLLTLNRLSVLPLLSSILADLVKALFRLCCGGRSPIVYREICYVYPSEDGPGTTDIETCRYTLRLHFLNRMFSHDDENGRFWKEDAISAFPSLTSMLRGDHTFASR